jgi:hypothetical protein
MRGDFRRAAHRLPLMLEVCEEAAIPDDIFDRDEFFPEILFGDVGAYPHNARLKRLLSHVSPPQCPRRVAYRCFWAVEG